MQLRKNISEARYYTFNNQQLIPGKSKMAQGQRYTMFEWTF